MVESYTRVQKILHWVLAILVLFWLLVSGQFAEAAEGDTREEGANGAEEEGEAEDGRGAEKGKRGCGAGDS